MIPGILSSDDMVWKALNKKIPAILKSVLSFNPHRLRGKLLTIIAIKILFLFAFWHLVLSKQVVRIDQNDMQKRIFPN